jgi:hypothetical protein
LSCSEIPKIRYQNNITLFEIGDIPIQIALPSIPFRVLKFKDNTVITPYDEIKIKLMELYDNTSTKIDMHDNIGKRRH